MFQKMRYTSRLLAGKKCFDVVKREKFTKGEVIKRIMREQKQAFGALLETKKEKTERLKRENGEKFSTESNETDVDSELSWMMKVSDRRLKRLKVIDSNEFSELKNSQSEKIIPEKMMRLNRKVDFGEMDFLRPGPSVKIIKIESKNFIDNYPAVGKKRHSTKETENESRRTQVPSSTLESNKKSLLSAEVSRSEKKDCEEIVQSSMTLKPKRILKAKKVTSKSAKRSLVTETHAPLFYGNESNDLWPSSKILGLSAAEDKEILKFPSVTKILNLTMSDIAKRRLEIWLERMIDKLGQEGFDEYKKGLLENGKLLHSSIDNALRKLPVQVPENIRPCFNSVQSVLEEIDHVRAIESHVVHRNLRYRGVIDCVASYRGNMCLIDWKKSDRVKSVLSSTYDAPLQIASYIGALNADKNYPFQIKSGLIVVAYTTGNPPTVYRLDEARLQFYWQQWLRRLKKYYTMQNT